MVAGVDELEELRVVEALLRLQRADLVVWHKAHALTEGTPMEEMEPVSIWDMVRMVATTRIVMPKTQVRLSAGRTEMSREGQAMCFFAGANSIFAGDKLLTTPNPDVNEDMEMFKLLGLQPQAPFVKKAQPETVEAEASQFAPLGEKPKWTRPGHKIVRNETAKANAKERL